MQMCETLSTSTTIYTKTGDYGPIEHNCSRQSCEMRTYGYVLKEYTRHEAFMLAQNIA